MKKFILTVLFIFFTLSVASCFRPENVRAANNYRKCNPDEVACQASVTVFITPLNGRRHSGSGVVISSDGLILTEAHVTGEVLEAAIEICSEEKAKLHCEPAYLVAFDYRLDLALIQVLRHFRVPAQLGSSAKLHWSSPLYVISTPEDTHKILFHQTLTPVQFDQRGIFWEDYDTIIPKLRLKAVTAEIAPGSSGGGVFDAEGRLVGMIQRCDKNLDGTPDGRISYAIPVEVIRFFLQTTRGCTGAPNACMPQ